MKLLVVHEVSYPKKVVYEIHEFPELLALEGHDVTFVDFDEGATRREIGEPRDRVIMGRIHPQATLRLVTPHRFGIPSIDRIWAIFSSMPLFWKLIKRGGFDAILNFAVPTYGLQVTLLGKLFGVPVLQRALDVASKIRKSPWNPLIALFERLCFRWSSLVSTNNPAMTKYVMELMGDKFQDKIVMHYPPLDQRIFKATTRDIDLASSLGIKASDKVLIYMGSFFYFSGLDEVIVELAKSVSKDPAIKLLLIGGGEQEALLRELVESNNLSNNVVFSGFVPFHDLPRYMSLGDVALNPLIVSTVASAAFPHKVLQYMAVGLPTVSTKLDGLYAAFGDDSGLRWASSPTEVLEIALNILGNDQDSRESQIRLQREVLDRLFSPTVTVNKLEETLLEISRRRRNNA
jgi:glycosyltransferase involved in cell wall biosynthesis